MKNYLTILLLLMLCMSFSFVKGVETIAGQTVNVVPLYALLEKYNTHIISGHMHYNHNVVHSPKLMEHITGAVGGTWWQGNICLDGTPQGYGVYEVEGINLEHTA